MLLRQALCIYESYHNDRNVSSRNTATAYGFSFAEPVLKYVRVLTCRQFLPFVTQFSQFLRAVRTSRRVRLEDGKIHTWWTTTQPPWRMAYLTTMHQQWKWLPSTTSGKKVREVKIYLFFRTVTFLPPPPPPIFNYFFVRRGWQYGTRTPLVNDNSYCFYCYYLLFCTKKKQIISPPIVRNVVVRVPER